jgi:hypothetical protein
VLIAAFIVKEMPSRWFGGSWWWWSYAPLFAAVRRPEGAARAAAQTYGLRAVLPIARARR